MVKTSLRELEPALEHYAVHASEAREVRSGFNHHFRITTPDGEKHLIIFRPQLGKPAGHLQFEMRQHVLSQGFHLLPRPVPTAAGRPFAKTALGTVSLSEWVPGDTGSAEPDWSGPLLCRAGQILARLHQAVRDYHPEPVATETLAPLYWPADLWVARGDALLDEFRANRHVSPAAAESTARHLEATRALFDPDAYGEALAVGTSVVHGDFRPANLILDSGKIVAVVDFDAAFWESRVYDLAYASFQFGGDECVYPQERQESGAGFVHCYTRSWPLSDAERRLLPFFLRQVVVKRLLSGRDVESRLRLLDQLDEGLADDLVRAAA